MADTTEIKKRRGRPSKAFLKQQSDKAEALKLIRSQQMRDKIKDTVATFISQVKTSRSSLESNWANWYDSYLQQAVSPEYGGVSKLDLGMLHQQVEIATAFFETTLFSTTPPFEIVPTEPSDQEEADLRKTVLNWQMEQMDFRRKIKDGTRKKLIYGTQFYKIVWRKFPKKVVTSVTKRGKVTKSEQGEKLDLILLNNRDIFIDPYLTTDDFDNADMIVHRSMSDEGYLNRMGKSGTYDKVQVRRALRKSKTESKPAPKDIYQEDSPEQRAQTYYQFGDRPTSHIRKFQLDEVWFNYDIYDNGEAIPCLAVIVDGDTVVRLDENPNWDKSHPFMVDTFLPLDGFIYGRGIPAINEDLNVAGRDFLNQVMDDINLIINNPWITTQNANIRQENMRMYPNKLFISRTTTADLVPLQKPNIIPDGLEAIRLMVEMSKMNSGVTDTLQGRALGGRTSATEATRVFDQAFNRMLSHVKDTENDVFKKFLNKAWKINEQMMTKEMFFRIVGQKGLEYKEQFPKSVTGDFDATPTGINQIENKSAKLQSLMGYINIVANMPPAMSMAKMPKLLEKAYELFGFKDYANVHQPSPENQLISIADENIVLAQNGQLMTHPFDNDEEHLAGHQGDPEAAKTDEGQIHIQMHAAKLGQQPAGNNGIGEGSTSPQSLPQGNPEGTQQGGLGDLLGNVQQASGGGQFMPQG